MVWIIDLIIVLLIGISMLLGYKKGLIKVAIKILSFIIAIVVSLILYKPVSNIIIEKTEVDDVIQNSIIEKILPEGADADDEVEVDQSLKSLLSNKAANTVNNIAEDVTIKIIEGACLLVIYIAIRIILIFVSALAGLIDKIPVIKQFNKTGGLIYGLLKGIILVWFILAIVYLASPLIETDIISDINNAMLGGLLYRNNLLMKLIV